MAWAQSFYKNMVSFGSMLVALASFEKAKVVDAPIDEPMPERAPHHGRGHYKWHGNPRRPMSAAFKRQIAKQREIGIDPIYMNGSREQRRVASKAWQPISREWDAKHPVSRHG